jgi:predicted MFS family arabinose efflux permease
MPDTLPTSTPVPAPSRHAAWPVTLWLGLVVAVASASAAVVQVLAPAIAEDLGLPGGFVGLYTSGIWLSMIFLSSSVGSLLARHGGWRLAQACLLLCALGLACAASATPVGLAAAAILIGLAHGLEGPVSSQLLVQHVPPGQRPLLFSVKQSGVQLGAVAASSTLPLIALMAGWQWACAAVIGVLLASTGLLQRARRVHETEAGPVLPRIGALEAMRRMARSPALLRLALASAAFAGTQVCLSSWFTTWAVRDRGLSLVDAGRLLAVAQIGGLVGRILWGWVATRTGRATPLLRTLGLVMTLCGLLLGLGGGSLPLAGLYLVVACFGLTVSGWNGVFLAEVAHRAGPQEVASATGAVMVIMTAGLVLGPLVFGVIGTALSYGTAYALLAGLTLAGALVLPRQHTTSGPGSSPA